LKTSNFSCRVVDYGESLESRRDLADSAIESLLQPREGVPVINGAERFAMSGGGFGNHDRDGMRAGSIQQFAEEFHREAGHVAGHDQVVLGVGMAQGGQDSAERTFAGVEVGNHGITESGVSRRIADQHGASRHAFHYVADASAERFVAHRQEGLVAPHAAAPSPHQDVTRSLHNRNDTIGDYGEILYGWRANRPLPYNGDRNILTKICSTLSLSALMATGLWGANPDAAPSRMTSVVHADMRTGKLVRSVVVSPRVLSERSIAPAVVAPQVVEPAAPAAQAPVDPPTGISELVDRIAAEHALSPRLIHAVIKAESNYNPTAISPKGALGLMQLIPSTARRFGVTHVFDPVENIQGGARYLKYLLELYEDNTPLALAAYNAGEAAVAKYNGIPPFAETQNYVIQVEKNLQKLAAAAQAKPAPAPVAPSASQPSGPTHVQEVVDPDGTVRYVSR
jgi:hypothetical protein